MYEELKKSLRLCGRMINADDNCIAYYDGSCERWPVCAYDLMKQAADAIEELSKQHEQQRQNLIALMNEKPRWISVEERLPEIPDGELFSRPVYVTDGEDIKRVCRTVGYDGEEGWEYCGLGKITHWCERIPLPSAPAEE